MVGGHDILGNRMTKLRPIAVMLVVMGFALPFGAARAEPLEADTCKALKSEKKALLTATVQAALRRGPDWVKDNLHEHDKIEQVRQYLQVEEKVAFRCRTNGVRIPKPQPPSLPDRKPKVPTFVLAGVDATSLIPLRNPSREAREEVTAAITASEGEGEGDIDDEADLASDTTAEVASGADASLSSTEAGVSAASEAIAKEEATIRQGLAKP